MAENLIRSASIDLHRLARALTFGAVGAIALCLLLWATAAAKAAPETYPAWIREFGPRQGLERLWLGLLLSGLSGAALLGFASAAWDLVRHGGGGTGQPARRRQVRFSRGGFLRRRAGRLR